MIPSDSPQASQEKEKATLRSPDTVMKLDRMGASFPTRLSFMRVLIRRLNVEKTEVTRIVWQIDANGFGRAVYSLQLGGNIYSLVAFSTKLAPESRTDRVIAEAWDASFALFDGTPTKQDLDRLEQNIPKQEAGRYEASELVISRANKSVRYFEHVVDHLSKGEQPDADLTRSVGYLMRTTAVYGNGKFGFADRTCIADRPELSGPFQAEMLTVWLIRGFTHDLVQHVAKARNSIKFVPLANGIRKSLGIGNSTGLGMAPFLVNHPVLLNNWALAREKALARVCAVALTDIAIIEKVQRLIERARQHVEEWNVEDPRQMARINILRAELGEVQKLIAGDWLKQKFPWKCLIEASVKWSLECQELVISMILEPYGNLIDDLSHTMSDHTGMKLDPAMRVKSLNKLLEENYHWALDLDFDKEKSCHYFWYTSQEKLEPRLGERQTEPGFELELPLDIARQASALAIDLSNANPNQSIALFLTNHPHHRHITRRIQTSKRYPFCEIRDNLIGEDCLPLDILRYKLSFFGASKCDPKSNLWTRINMYQGAPLFDDITQEDADDWWLPSLKSVL